MSRQHTHSNVHMAAERFISNKNVVATSGMVKSKVCSKGKKRMATEGEGENCMCEHRLTIITAYLWLWHVFSFFVDQSII